MALASHVFLILRGAVPVGTWTVKQELVDWLRREALEAGDLQAFQVWRLPDGPPGDAQSSVRLSVYDLLLSERRNARKPRRR